MKPTGIRCVAPFRPFPPETPHHVDLDDFDWIGAIRMLRHSVAVACGDCPFHVITDVDTTLPFPLLRYRTTHRRLMLWYLEIACCYLESADFDRDTVMLDSDQLIFGNLARWFDRYVDLGILVRCELPKQDPSGLPILNGVQFWAHRAKDRLAGFYRRALEIAVTLPEDALAWGADTVALVKLLEPLDTSLIQERAGLRVRMIDADSMLRAFSTVDQRQIKARRVPLPLPVVLDFRGYRKPWMRPAYEATILRGVAVCT